MPKATTFPEPRDAWAPADRAPLLGTAAALALAICALGLLYLLSS